MRVPLSINSLRVLNVLCGTSAGRPECRTEAASADLRQCCYTGSKRARRLHRYARGLASVAHCVVPAFGKAHIAQFSWCVSWCARRDSNPHDVTHCHLKAARLPIPPRALFEFGPKIAPDRSTARDVTNRGWGDKACKGCRPD